MFWETTSIKVAEILIKMLKNTLKKGLCNSGITQALYRKATGIALIAASPPYSFVPNSQRREPKKFPCSAPRVNGTEELIQ